ncbi:MAG: penicillin-binding protein 2 [Tepidiformaceae bacterium]
MSLLDGPGSGRRVEGPSRTRPNGNLFALKVTVVLLFGILTAQLVNMQIIQGADYARRSRENHILATNILPARGLIYDRNGAPLVQNTGLFTASVIPDFLPDDPDERYLIYRELERITGEPALAIQSIVAEYEEDQPWTEIPVKRDLTQEEALILEQAAVDLPGVRLTITPSREYTGGTTLSHILGYIGPQSAEEVAGLRKQGYDINEPVGKTGVEAWYESELRGEIGQTQNETDAFGRVINTLSTIESTPGSGLKLSIDAGLQDHVADVLLNQLGPSGSSHAAAVVMDPNTGEILALVSVPSYDNNVFSSPTDPDNADTIAAWVEQEWGKPLTNHAISDANIPGSVFKLVTATAGLEEGVINQGTYVYAPKVLEQKDVNGELFPLVDWQFHGGLTLRDGIAWSSNIYMYMVACGSLDGVYPGLGATKLGTWARNFGLGSTTGIDLYGETAGFIPSPEWKRRWSLENFGVEQDWYYGNDCFMGIGQEYITASPLQIARMTAAVANGGTLVTPHVATEIIAPDGTVTRITPDTKKIPVDDANLQVVREGMFQSVTSAAAKNAQVSGVSVAGKTGTAEFRLRGDGVTYDNHAWFTGYAPYDNPEVVVTVYFELGWGGDLAAPAASRILEYYFENVSP